MMGAAVPKLIEAHAWEFDENRVPARKGAGVDFCAEWAITEEKLL
jgi:hypothetical protein